MSARWWIALAVSGAGTSVASPVLAADRIEPPAAAPLSEPGSAAGAVDEDTAAPPPAADPTPTDATPLGASPAATDDPVSPAAAETSEVEVPAEAPAPAAEPVATPEPPTSTSTSEAPEPSQRDEAEGWMMDRVRSKRRKMPGWITPYGSVRLDVVFNDSAFQDAETAMWVLSEDEDAPDTSGINNNDLNIHPRLSRIGLDFFIPGLPEAMRIDGNVEIDFQNGSSERKVFVRLRKAYGNFGYKWFELRAGQDYDLISPFIPSANNDGYMWNAGNTGAWRPQLRLTAAPQFGKLGTRFAVSVGAGNSVDEQDLDRDRDLDGVDASIPNLQALAEISGRWWTKSRPFTVGVTGHFAQQWVGGGGGNPRPEGPVYDDPRRLNAWSVGAHLQVPIIERLWVVGEFFAGQALSDIRGGIGQSVHLETGEELFSMGGWVEVAGKPTQWLTLVGGVSIDDPQEVADGQRARNFAAYGVARVRPVEPFAIQLEYLYWTTAYADFIGGLSNRINLSTTFYF